MPRANPRPPSEIAESIQEKATSVRELATAVSEQIAEVEAVLRKLPGRVEAYCYGNHPDATYDTPIQLGLALRREDKVWTLLQGTHHPEFDDAENPMSWTPLVDAPVRIKVAAIKLLPELLAAIEMSQEALMKEYAEAAEQASAFASSLKARTKEGK